MLGAGVTAIAAGVLVALRPRIGGFVVAGWLARFSAAFPGAGFDCRQRA